jgi:hypothetical protein
MAGSESERHFTGEQLVEGWNLSDGCGGGGEHHIVDEARPRGNTIGFHPAELCDLAMGSNRLSLCRELLVGNGAA